MELLGLMVRNKNRSALSKSEIKEVGLKSNHQVVWASPAELGDFIHAVLKI
jgi:hypothetical protein